MKYSKNPLAFGTQIQILKNRGLHFGNEDLAEYLRPPRQNLESPVYCRAKATH